MIDHYRISLKYGTEKSFRGNPGYRMYGCLMELLPGELCESMHENVKTPISQNIEYSNRDGTAVWYISSFDEQLSLALDDLFNETNEFSLERDEIILKTEKIERTHLDGFADIRRFSEKISGCQSVTLRFLTTTALKKNGDFLLFPDMELIIDNLWNQWNVVFPNNPLDDEDVLRMIKRQTYISEYSLNSSRYKLKNIGIKGFYGRITVSNRLSAPLRELVAALLAFSEFNGVGVKNALGMGKTAVADTYPCPIGSPAKVF